LATNPKPLSKEEVDAFEMYDLVYRSMCAVLYNFVPMSGHPGGSISSGRFVSGIVFDAMDYDMSDPDRADADILSYAAGHKALGLYAMWALRNEMMVLGARDLMPSDDRHQLRIEDLLGFRRNPMTKTPLFVANKAKALDGHPTPATPFVKLATGASGVGIASSLGLAIGARDYWGENAPKVHIVEGEGGMTPGRVGEAMAAAGTASMDNVIMHIDWNQASIDSEHVCRDEDEPGDYVQWNPMEFAYLHDWNVVYVPDGFDFQQIMAAQRLAKSTDNGQPTAIVYRTTKGWQYGIEGKASHGAGHKLCEDGFHKAIEPLLEKSGGVVPRCESGEPCDCGKIPDVVEECFWDSLYTIRTSLDSKRNVIVAMGARLVEAKQRLDKLGRKPRDNAPQVDAVFDTATKNGETTPEELRLDPGASTTLRGELGRVLNYFNKASNGALMAAAADLLGSTSVLTTGKGFPQGFYNARTNPESRILSIGGICEDAMSGVLSGLSSYGYHIGAGSSYGAFIAALGHISARLHAIGNQSRQLIKEEPYKPFILICAHAGVKTGEDGPTHADPQPLQILQENFPRGTMITLTPWDPQEMWPLMAAALNARPCVIAPFVTRPNETILDREALGIAPASDARTGVYALRRAKGTGDGTVVLQGSEVCYEFVNEAMPRLNTEGMDLNVYYVASVELFDALSATEQERIFPRKHRDEAMGITGFTLPTMYRWITSDYGRAMTMYPFKAGHFLGSGKAEAVVAEARLDGKSQFESIMRYLSERATA
jgi:transketolase